MRAAATRSLSRRQFLHGLGATAALGPFLPLLNAHAATGAPRRLLLFFTPHGHLLPRWTPTGTSSNFKLNSSMAPLAPHLSKLNVLGGVAMKGWFHQNGGGQVWTGCEIPTGPNGEEPSAYPVNPSIDQVVAASQAGATAYRSLEFGVNAGGAYGDLTRTIWAGRPVQALEPNQSPSDAFRQLFGHVDTRTLTENTSVLDAIAGDLNSLTGRVSVADGYKIDQHLTAVRALETRLSGQSAACMGPNLQADPLTRQGASMPSDFASFIDIIGSAFTCDLTRVASIQLAKVGNDGDTYTWINNSGDHHGLTHANPSDTADENGNPVASQARSVNGQLAAIDTWYCKMFAHLLDQLDSVPEGAGTVLDNTLVVWGTELAHCYTHATGQGGTPFITAGGGGLGVQGGRWLQYPASDRDEDLETPQTEHNRLLVSIANYMGVNVNKFGASDRGSGPLPGF